MNNSLNFLFGMYEPATDSIIANVDENTILVIHCKECNSSALFQIRIERKRIAELCGCYELVQLLVPICLY